MAEEKRQKLIAFICGDALVSVFTMGGIMQNLGPFGLKVLSTIILGICGGVAGLLGQDLYKRFKKWRSSNKKANGTGNV